MELHATITRRRGHSLSRLHQLQIAISEVSDDTVLFHILAGTAGSSWPRNSLQHALSPRRGLGGCSWELPSSSCLRHSMQCSRDHVLRNSRSPHSPLTTPRILLHQVIFNIRMPGHARPQYTCRCWQAANKLPTGQRSALILHACTPPKHVQKEI